MTQDGRLVTSLRAAGLRVTGPRVAVYDALAQVGHVDVDELVRRVRERLGSVSVQAVYDVLNVLVDLRLVRRIEPSGSPALFERRVGDNHHHLVCRGCGAVVDVDCVVGAAPCLTAVADADFLVDEAEVTFWGMCPSCR